MGQVEATMLNDPKYLDLLLIFWPEEQTWFDGGSLYQVFLSLP